MSKLIIALTIVATLALSGCGSIGKTRAEIERDVIPHADLVQAVPLTVVHSDSSQTTQLVCQYRDRFDEWQHGAWADVRVLYTFVFKDDRCTDRTWSESSTRAADSLMPWAR